MLLLRTTVTTLTKDRNNAVSNITKVHKFPTSALSEQQV